MASVRFAVKDAINMTLTPIGVSDKEPVAIDYLNSCNLSLDSETTYARKKGNNAIAFTSARSGTFQMEAEVIDDQYLAWMLGGSLDDDGSIHVGGTAPNVAYKISGTFAIQTETNGTQTRYIEMYNCRPQVATDLTLSATEVSNFTLTFDVMVDETDNILDLFPTDPSSHL